MKITVLKYHQGALERILWKRTNFGIPNEINAVRSLRKTRGSLAAQMERGEMRDGLTQDYAPLHPGYGLGAGTTFAPVTKHISKTA